MSFGPPDYTEVNCGVLELDIRLHYFGVETMVKKLIYVICCGFVLWMEASNGEYQPVVGFESKDACMASLETARREIGTEIYLTCFPSEFDPRKAAERPKE